MNWEKSIKVLRDNPYLIDDAYVISYAEADRIFREDFPTFEELIDLSKKKFALPSEEWVDFDSNLAARTEKRQQPNRMKDFGAVITGQFSQHKRLAIACLIVLILSAFFSFVPAGQALAEQFFNMVVHVLGDSINIVNKNTIYQKDEYGNSVIVVPTNPQRPNATPGTRSFTSIKEFTDQTKFKPVIIQSDRIKCTGISMLTDDDLGQILTTKYLYDNKLHVNVIQRWNSDADTYTQSKDSSFQQRTILNSKILYYTKDAKDKSFTGIALLDTSILMIGADDGVDIEIVLGNLIIAQ